MSADAGPDAATAPGRHAASTDLAPREEPLPVLPDPEQRGTLTVAEKVVERVAGYAVTQVDGAGAAPRRLLGINVGEARPDSEASVSAQVDGSTATVRATVAIAWPQPVRRVADRVRAAIREDVARMTDVQVAQVDLEVVSFATPSAPPRRVR